MGWERLLSTSAFKFEGELWSCTNLADHGQAYRLVPLEKFPRTPTTYAAKSRDGDAARADRDGFYDGIKIQNRKRARRRGSCRVSRPPLGLSRRWNRCSYLANGVKSSLYFNTQSILFFNQEQRLHSLSVTGSSFMLSNIRKTYS